MSIYRSLVEMEECGQSGALCTIIRSSGSTPRHQTSKMLVYPDGKILGSIGGGALESLVIEAAVEVIKDGKPRLLSYNMSDPQRGDPGVCGGQLEIFVEPILPKPILVVVGAGHVGKAVAHLAHWLGFRVVISDDRPELCTPGAVPDADEFYQLPLAELPAHLLVTASTYIVLTTRSVDIDVPGLPALLDTPAAYIGIIGSCRRWETTQTQLIERGISLDKLGRVRSPIGLDINAETPEEIAISIMAEIIKQRRES